MVVLILLVIVSILGLSAAQVALMGERGTRNDRDRQIAWQAAEAALMDAEFDMRGPGTASRKDIFRTGNSFEAITGCSNSGNSKGLCQTSKTDKPVWVAVDFTTKNSPSAEFGDFTGRTFDAGSSGLKPARSPRYIIEALKDTEAFNEATSQAPVKIVYRVTAMGFGPREDIQAVTQMVFRKE
jgi:type IV pilus assembly protein PilX